ncbi:MAG: DNA-3-methyladenine glycosylase I [Acidimicrobiales bacterium]
MPGDVTSGVTSGRAPAAGEPGGPVAGGDGFARCPWGASPPEYRHYHDLEWGLPVADEVRVFEKLCLEGFQSGLSWLTILRKRAAFRKAFASFDPGEVAGFDERDVCRLLEDTSIVRHRGKIEATIANARAVVALRAQGGSLSQLLWAHEAAAPGRQPPSRLGEVPAATPESKALSSELRRRGFRFVGPTTVYAAMQALGVVNDHLAGCHFRAVAAAERAAFSPPG